MDNPLWQALAFGWRPQLAASRPDDTAEPDPLTPQQSARSATSEADRVRLVAEAAAWKQMLAELKSQNESLQKRLEEILAQASTS